MKPLLLLLPGTLCDARVWDAVVAPLHALAEVRCADTRGAASVAELADTAWHLLADVAPTRPLLLAGFSLGGFVAIEMLARPRRAVRGAAMLSTTACPDSAEAALRRARGIAALATDFERSVERLLDYVLHAPDPSLRARVHAMMREVGAAAAIRQNRAAAGRPDRRAALRGLALPVTVLCGAHDRITPPAGSEELAALIPHARLTLVPEAGHMLPCEQPDAVGAALRDLLAHP